MNQNHHPAQRSKINLDAMSHTSTILELPNYRSSEIHLTNPTPQERLQTWRLNSAAWQGALTPSLYIQKESHLTALLQTKPDGITHWILVPKHLPPNQRPILASCETIPKRCLVRMRQEEGDMQDMVVHGVAGVFCNPAWRRRGYASRMMVELAGLLRRRADEGERSCAGSVLWSDVGRRFYADCGWVPFASVHVEFPPVAELTVLEAENVLSGDVEMLCEEDEALLRKAIAGRREGKRYMALVPDHHTMLWHHKKEEFICERLFDKQPLIKGAIIGEPGNRIWAIWTHSFYGPLDDPDSGNTLYILRLVVENESPTRNIKLQTDHLAAVLLAAQLEAAEWKLLHVEFWNPTSLIQDLIERTGIQHRTVERECEGIPSLLWFGAGSGKEDEIEWVGNEKFAWC